MKSFVITFLTVYAIGTLAILRMDSSPPDNWAELFDVGNVASIPIGQHFCAQKTGVLVPGECFKVNDWKEVVPFDQVTGDIVMLSLHDYSK